MINKPKAIICDIDGDAVLTIGIEWVKMWRMLGLACFQVAEGDF